MKQGVIGVFSGKGGVGKTTVTINLATAFSQLKRNSIAIDTDMKMTGLGLHLGMYQFPVTLNDVLLSKNNLYEALYIHTSGLRIIPAPLYVQDINTSGLKSVLSTPFLSDNFVFIDSPPGLEQNVIDVLNACPSGIIVVTPDVPSITDAMKIVSMMEKTGTNPLGIIINMYNKNDKSQINSKEIESAFNLPVLGIIPFDKFVRKSIFHKTPVIMYNPHSPASIEFKKISAKLLNENYKSDSLAWIKNVFRRLSE